MNKTEGKDNTVEYCLKKTNTYLTWTNIKKYFLKVLKEYFLFPLVIYLLALLIFKAWENQACNVIRDSSTTV